MSTDRCELDSHADTTLAGANMLFLDDRHDAPTINVHGFTDDFKPVQNVPIGTCATAYDCPDTGRVHILLFGQALYFGNRMPASLLCPNQIRMNGNRVEDTPIQFEPASNHGLTLHDPDSNHSIFIPFQMDGQTSYMTTRIPTQSELQSNNTLHYWATSEDVIWNPQSDEFAENERNARKIHGDVQPTTRPVHREFPSRPGTHSRNISEVSVADDGLLFERLYDKRRISSTCAGDIYEEELSETLSRCREHHTRVSAFKFILGERAASRAAASDDYRLINSIKTGNKKADAESLARRWGIGLSSAVQTLLVTTQKGLRNATHPVQKRFKRQPFHRKRMAPGKWFSDTTFFKKKSIINGNSCAQLTTNGKGFATFLPLRSKACASDGLVHFINEIGIPEFLITDGSKEQGSQTTWRTSWMNVVKKYHIKQSWIEPHSWWQNAAEREIGEVKRDIRRFTQRTKSPRRLWSFLGVYIVRKRSLTASKITANEGRTPFERVVGYTPDIGVYYMFEWYDFVYYLDEGDNETRLARWLGPASDYGDGSCHWLLPVSCKPMVRSTVWNIPREDRSTDARAAEMARFNEEVASKIGDDFQDGTEASVQYEIFDEEFDEDMAIVSNEEEAIPDAEFTPEEYDEYLTAEVMIPIGDGKMKGVVKRRVKDDDGLPVGKRHPNPILDSREYEVELSDGTVDSYTANMIADNIYAQCDDEGNMYTMMDEILDHRKNGHAIEIENGWIHTKQGTRRRKITTAGWELLVQFKDDTARWVRLADLKASFPIETAEYALNNKIIEQPAFAWWAKDALRRRDRTICKAKTRYWKRTHKYGIELPKSIQDALQIDKRTGTDFWRKALEKEMKNVMIAFEYTEDGKPPLGHERLGYHMIFDIKITLDRKCRLVADGQRVAEQPKENTYSSVPSRDTVRIFFLMAALNDCDVMAADIQNAYLTAPVKEKYYVKCGPEFGVNAGKTAKVVRALYGLPVAGAAFRSYLGQNLRTLGYVPMKADPDLWMRPAVKPDGIKYYEYLLAYVDDLCGMSMDTKNMFDAIGNLFTLKKESVKEPDLYLGANIEKKFFDEEPSKARWAMSSTNYTKKAIEEVERELTKADKRLPTKVSTPLGHKYRPELDQTPELDDKRQNYYQGLIGVLRWICELGRLDLLVSVSLMSRYLAQAREGQLEQVFHIFAYLKQYSESKLVFDDGLPYVDESRFSECDWREFYPGAKEAIPKDAPEVRGNPVSMYCFVDADHAGCKQTRRSHTGVIIYINRAPILWFSKRQNTVETSTYGSEIVALRIAIELIEGLRYKLRMMGVPMEGACRVFCDNDSVVQNTTRPESPLRKKANSICYHKARESIAAGWIKIAKEPGETNVSDLLTKLVSAKTMSTLVPMCMWRH